MNTLEKTAKAMFDADSKANEIDRDWELERHVHPTYSAMARAALEAIREPSEASATRATADLDELGLHPLEAAAVFTDMINAILRGEA